MSACEKCGAFGDMPHVWTEGDCLLGHNGHPRATVGHCCQGCVDRMRDWLTEITELYADLPRVIDLGSVPDDTAEHKHQRKRPASPALVRLDAWAMVADRARHYRSGSDSDLPDVPAVLADLAQNVCDDLGISQQVDTLTSAATLLSSRMEDVARSGWVDECDAELRWLRRKLRTAHGISDPQALGRCITVTDGRDCGGWVYPSRDHDERPRCQRCNRRYGTLDYVRLKGMEQAG